MLTFDFLIQEKVLTNIYSSSFCHSQDPSSRHELHSDSWQNASSENFYFSYGWSPWILYLRWHCIQRIKKQYNTNLILYHLLITYYHKIMDWSTVVLDRKAIPAFRSIHTQNFLMDDLREDDSIRAVSYEGRTAWSENSSQSVMAKWPTHST